MRHLALTLTEEGRYSDAEIVWRKIIDIQGRGSGKELPAILTNLGVALIREGRYAEAERWMQDAIEKAVRISGPESADTALAVYNLACLEALTRRPDAALSHLSHAVEHGLPTNDLLGMATDPDLKSLHGDSRFKELLAQAKEQSAKH